MEIQSDFSALFYVFWFLETDSYMHNNLNYFCIKVSPCYTNISFIYLDIYTFYATYKHT